MQFIDAKRAPRHPLCNSGWTGDSVLRLQLAVQGRRRTEVIGVAGLLCLGGMCADTCVGIQTDVKKFVPADMHSLVDMHHNGVSVLGGTDQLNVILKADDVTDPAMIDWMDRFSAHEVELPPYISSGESIVGPVKAANQRELKR